MAKSSCKSEAYTKLSQTSKIELFAKIVSGSQLLTISVKSSILDVWQGSEWTSEVHPINLKEIWWKLENSMPVNGRI